MLNQELAGVVSGAAAAHTERAFPKFESYPVARRMG